MMPAHHSILDRQEPQLGARSSLQTLGAPLRYLATAVSLALAGFFLITSPASGAVSPVRPSAFAGGFYLTQRKSILTSSGAPQVRSGGDAVGAALRRAANRKASRWRFEGSAPPALEIRTSHRVLAASKDALEFVDLKSGIGRYRDYGFSFKRAGIRFRFSLVESAGRHS